MTSSYDNSPNDPFIKVVNDRSIVECSLDAVPKKNRNVIDAPYIINKKKTRKPAKFLKAFRIANITNKCTSW